MKTFKSKIHLISDKENIAWNISQIEPKFLDAIRAGDVELAHKYEKELEINYKIISGRVV